ncbi:flagellar biosynthetic protein FliO [Celerinatantimonas yamalensis]|uniref:Flagellar protein n=1 Tax=Celerinatantimonas yamalensis TaxID=559956 RepID=A0ABW9G8Q7_9GAMM
MKQLVVIILTFWPVLAQAKETVGVTNQPLDTGDWLSWSLSMILVLMAIGICAWLAKKSRFSGFGHGQMRVVASLTLGTRERILVVQVGSQQYLLGVTHQHIELLDKLAEPLQGTPQTSNFSQQLNRILKGNAR